MWLLKSLGVDAASKALAAAVGQYLPVSQTTTTSLQPRSIKHQRVGRRTAFVRTTSRCCRVLMVLQPPPNIALLLPRSAPGNIHTLGIIDVQQTAGGEQRLRCDLPRRAQLQLSRRCGEVKAPVPRAPKEPATANSRGHSLRLAIRHPHLVAQGSAGLHICLVEHPALPVTGNFHFVSGT